MKADRVGGIISILLGGLSISEAIRLYPQRMTDFGEDHTLPGVVGGALILLGAFLIFVKGKSFKVEFPNRKIMVGMLLTFGLLFAYWFTLQYLGYIISTFLVSIGLFKIMGTSSYYKSIIYSALLTTALYLIFIYWLAMPFPAGIFDL